MHFDGHSFVYVCINLIAELLLHSERNDEAFSSYSYIYDVVKAGIIGRYLRQIREILIAVGGLTPAMFDKHIVLAEFVGYIVGGLAK